MQAKAVKEQFDIPAGLIYLAMAAESPIPRQSQAAGLKGMERKYHPWEGPEVPASIAAAEACRGLFGALIGASGENIALQPATSYGVATAALNLPLAKGQSVLLLDDPFPSDYYSWKTKAEDVGARLKIVPRPADGDWTAAVSAALTPDVGIAVLPPCHWTDGSLLRLEQVAPKLRQIGAALFIDATQGAGANAFDMEKIQPDYLVCSGYKWLLSPYTMALLYVAPHRIEGRPLEMHAGGRLGWEAGLTDTWAKGARRYDMGERYNDVNWLMAEQSLGLLKDWTPQAVACAIKPLTDQIAELARGRGWQVPPDHHRAPHYIGIRRQGGFPKDSETRLAQRGLYVSLRSGALRLAPYPFVTPEEIERAFGLIDAALS